VPQLKDVARYVRSKNAGPFWVTIDIFCDDRERFERVAQAVATSPQAVADLYGVPADQVARFPDPNLNVLKISFPRPVVAGAFTDKDAHAGQYFVPLLECEV
jgi:hypothetical protein